MARGEERRGSREGGEGDEESEGWRGETSGSNGNARVLGKVCVASEKRYTQGAGSISKLQVTVEKTPCIYGFFHCHHQRVSELTTPDRTNFSICFCHLQARHTLPGALGNAHTTRDIPAGKRACQHLHLFSLLFTSFDGQTTGRPGEGGLGQMGAEDAVPMLLQGPRVGFRHR